MQKAAATLANAVAAEYMRGQVELRLTKALAAAEAEMTRVSSIYGEEHPVFVRTQALLKQLQADEAALRSSLDEGEIESDIELRVAGQPTIFLPRSPSV